MMVLDKGCHHHSEFVTSRCPLPRPVPQEGALRGGQSWPALKDQHQVRRFYGGRSRLYEFETNAGLLVWTTTPTSR